MCVNNDYTECCTKVLLHIPTHTHILNGECIYKMRWVGHVARMGGEKRRIQGFGRET